MTLGIQETNSNVMTTGVQLQSTSYAVGFVQALKVAKSERATLRLSSYIHTLPILQKLAESRVATTVATSSLDVLRSPETADHENK